MKTAIMILSLIVGLMLGYILILHNKINFYQKSIKQQSEAPINGFIDIPREHFQWVLDNPQCDLNGLIGRVKDGTVQAIGCVHKKETPFLRDCYFHDQKEEN